MITVIAGNKVVRTDAARVQGNDLWLANAQLEQVIGIEKTQSVASQFQQDGQTNVSAAWLAANRPIVSDKAKQAWVLGASATERGDALQSLQAPDFTLADADGKPHSLSDYRGQKVFLTSWSSW